MSDIVRSRTRLHGLVLRLCTFWAILGGFVLLAVVLMNFASIVQQAINNKALPGDFEMTEIGVAIAVFSFLPYCQIAGLNVTADIFTARAPRWFLSLVALLAALVALGFGALMLWRMYAGMIDQWTYNSTTTILQIPLWWGFAGCLASLALLVLAAFASVVEEFTLMTRG